MTKMIYTGIALVAIGAVGTLIAIVMEIITAEPVYFIMMKAACGLFGIGGPLLGWAMVRRNRRC